MISREHKYLFNLARIGMKIAELFNVSGKVAIVTGGSRGIGEMIAAGFLANGVKVYITARKEAALIERPKNYQKCITVNASLCLVI